MTIQTKPDADFFDYGDTFGGSQTRDTTTKTKKPALFLFFIATAVFVVSLLLSSGCEAAGPLPSYPSLYKRGNYSSMCVTMRTTGDVAGQIVCEWYVGILKRDPEPAGLLYWRGRLASGEDVGKVYSQFIARSNNEAAGYGGIPAR